MAARRSPLETLRDLRARAKDAELARTATKAAEAAAAAAAADDAREALAAARREAEAARRADRESLGQRAFKAAEGQQRALWQRACREREARLRTELDRAVDVERGARRDHEVAQRALERADAELEQVQRRIDRAAAARASKNEAAQQETLDEAALRRFWQQGNA